jgi:hypothetical protein
MTDGEAIGLLLTGESTADVTDPDNFEPILPNGRVCQQEGCSNLLPDGSHPARKYCDEHFVGKGQRAERKRNGNNAERPPRLVVDVGGPRKTGGKSDQRARDTAQGAAAMLNVVATGFSMAGDQACAAAFVNGTPALSGAIGELSKFHPGISTFFAPVGAESEFGAWLGLLLAAAAIAVPVMAHHGVLPDSVGAKLGGVFVAAQDAAADQPAA